MQAKPGVKPKAKPKQKASKRGAAGASDPINSGKRGSSDGIGWEKRAKRARREQKAKALMVSSQHLEELFECENGVRTLTSTEITPVISEITSLVESDYFSDLGRDSAGNLTDKAQQDLGALNEHQSKLEAAKTVVVIYSKPKKKKGKAKKGEEDDDEDVDRSCSAFLHGVRSAEEAGLHAPGTLWSAILVSAIKDYLKEKSWGNIRDAFKERVTLTSGDVSDEPFAFARVAGKAQKQEEKKARIERSKLEMILECLKADFCWEADMEGLGDVVLMLNCLIDAEIPEEHKKALSEIRTVF